MNAKTLLLTTPFPNSSMVMTCSVLLGTLKADLSSIIPCPQGWGSFSRAIRFPRGLCFHSPALPQTNILQSTPPSPFQALGGDTTFPSAVAGPWEQLPAAASARLSGFPYLQSRCCPSSLAVRGGRRPGCRCPPVAGWDSAPARGLCSPSPERTSFAESLL